MVLQSKLKKLRSVTSCLQKAMVIVQGETSPELFGANDLANNGLLDEVVKKITWLISE